MVRWGRVFFGDTKEDIELALAANVTIVALADDNIQGYKEIGCVVLSSLLPPYESVCAEIDGDEKGAANIYYAYLNSAACSETLATIFAAIIGMKDIMFFIPPDESKNLKFSQVFMTFMYSTFGISFGNLKQPNIESVNTNNPYTMANIINLLFVYRYIGVETYAMLLPVGFVPSKEAIPLILESFNYRFNSMDECMNYCINVIQSIKSRPSELSNCPIVRTK